MWLKSVLPPSVERRFVFSPNQSIGFETNRVLIARAIGLQCQALGEPPQNEFDIVEPDAPSTTNNVG